MHQQRTCEHLGLKCTHRNCTHGAFILALPPYLRLRIYQEAGIISDSDIDLGHAPYTLSYAFATSFGATYALLQTNRTIYTEVSAYVYSTNRFFIHYRTRRSFQQLHNLSPTTLAFLRHLTIHLTVTSCEAGHLCCKAYPGRQLSCDDHDRALSEFAERHQTILNEWTLTAAYVFKYISSSTLRFYFVCDVSTPNVGQRVLAPLSNVRPLASCAIRLASKPDPVLQELARETALRAMGRDPHPVTPLGPSRFLALPHELQKNILYHTDLVSPLSEIQYSPDRTYHLHYSTFYCGDNQCPSSVHQACAVRNCWQRGGGNIGCFCSAAHTAFWTECRCWRPPTALFLVSKTVLEVAREVFLQANRFVIVPEGGEDWVTCRDVVDRSPERMPPAIFLTQAVPRVALRHLRFLEVVFPPFRTPYMLPHEPAYQQWQETIEMVRDHLTLPALTLRIYFADRLDDDSSEPPFRETMTKVQAMEIYKSYVRIVKPLQGLKGLSKLFMHVAWPWAWTPRGQWRAWAQRDVVKREIRDVEARLERMIMGKGHENKRTDEKELGESQWMDDGYR